MPWEGEACGCAGSGLRKPNRLGNPAVPSASPLVALCSGVAEACTIAASTPVTCLKDIAVTLYNNIGKQDTERKADIKMARWYIDMEGSKLTLAFLENVTIGCTGFAAFPKP
jgi:hypothetical protein